MNDRNIFKVTRISDLNNVKLEDSANHNRLDNSLSNDPCLKRSGRKKIKKNEKGLYT